MAEVLRLETPSLGDRSYLAHDGTVGVVVDPQRDTDRIAELAEQAGVRITHVAETHIHNDYVAGGQRLAREHRAEYLVNADDPVSFPRTEVRDGDVVVISPKLRLRVVATPGHTFSHLAYVLEEDGKAAGVFTGGSLLYSSTGRPELLGPANTGRLALARFESAQHLARELPDSAQVYPTHGFGSFCAATQAQGTSSTIGQEKLVNPALTLDQQAYVQGVLAGLDAFPTYYAHMGPANLLGPGGPDLTAPRPASAAQIKAAIATGEWVVDLRDRIAFAAGFVLGTASFPLDGSFATYLGWVMPWGTPVTLLGETPEQIARAQRELVRIGIDRPAAAATGGPPDWSAGAPVSSLRLAKFGDLAAAASQPDVTVLKVLAGIAAGYGIEVRKESQLTDVDGETGRAVVVNTRDGTKEEVRYDLLHAVPPQSAPDRLKGSRLADPATPAGYVNVGKYTMRSPDWPNVFSLGDVSNLPTSKTGAAIRKQAPALVANLRDVMAGREPSARYDGYTSCPLVTSRNRMLLAEFDYDLKPRPSIPFINTMKPRYDMWLLKRYGLPAMYWNLMMAGRA